MYHHVEVDLNKITETKVPAAEELHLGVDNDPDGGAVLLHLLEKGNGGLAMLQHLDTVVRGKFSTLNQCVNSL